LDGGSRAKNSWYLPIWAAERRLFFYRCCVAAGDDVRALSVERQAHCSSFRRRPESSSANPGFSR